MAKEVIFLATRDPDGGYSARALGFPIFTEAETWEALREAIQDAVRCHFDEEERPALVWLRIVEEEAIPV